MTTILGDKLPTLLGSRVSLRWLEDRDADDLFAIFSDPDVMRYWSNTPWTDRAAAVEMIESVRRCYSAGTLYQWGVTLRDDNAVIGTCTLADIHQQNRRAEIGFILRRDCWGQGLMSDATRTLLDFAFDQLNMHRIEADVDPCNEASIRLLERLGFLREGHLRERWLVGDEVNDTFIYGLLGREWRGESSLNCDAPDA